MIQCTFENGGKGLLRHVVTDTIVIKGGKILLAKRTKKILEGGKRGIIGGFLNRDENLQDCVAREVFEETGWRVKDITLLTIRHNPDRPHEDRQNVSFVFFATATEKEGEKDWESDDVQWFALDSLPNNTEIAFDHAEDIKLYKEYQEKKFSLPVFS